MNKLKIVSVLFLIVFSCKTENKPMDLKSKEQQIHQTSKIIRDTVHSTFPVGIGNDKGLV